MHSKLKSLAAISASALVLAACATTADSGSSSDTAASNGGSTITVGTTDKVVSLDPAGTYDNGSYNLQIQVYPFLMDVKPGSDEPEPTPNIAESAEFTSPTQYTVTLKEGLQFANGNDLTSSDIKFTFDRQVGIADPNGPSSLLVNLESVDAPNDTTVIFNLKAANDQTFSKILASPVAPILDEEVFPADSLLDDASIVAAKPFAGQYQIDTYTAGELAALSPNPNYAGELGVPQNDGVTIRYYADANNLRLDTENSTVDVAYRTFSATDIESMSQNEDLQVIEGPGGEIRYFVFNYNTMPFGAAQPDADPAKAQAVRQAIASLIDRESIAQSVYKDTYAPLYSLIPDGLVSATETFKQYGDGDGNPSVENATQILTDAGITEPVTLNLQYNPDHYGESSGDEYAAIKSQLEASGLFVVNLQSTEWVQYTEDFVSDVYPAYQLGWFPDISDADNYLAPFFGENNFLSNHYENPDVIQMIAEEITEPDPAIREQLLVDIQDQVTEDISTIPLLQGKQIAVAGADVSGVVLDATFKLNYASITK